MNWKTATLTLAGAALVGCSLSHATLRPGALFGQLGPSAPIISPKLCILTVVILARPIKDTVLNEELWSVADEQAVPPERRRELEANGLRIGVITGSLTPGIEAMLQAPPPHKVEPAQIELPSGDFTPIKLTASTPVASLFLNEGGETSGRDYRDVQGFFHLTAEHDGPRGVTLRLLPELHHGPVQHAWAATPSPSPLTAQQLTIKDGQKEEAFRDLAAAVTLQPRQILVVGCYPERGNSLGTFLFTEPELNSDRTLQKALLIEVARAGGEGTGPAKAQEGPAAAEAPASRMLPIVAAAPQAEPDARAQPQPRPPVSPRTGAP